MRAPPVWGAPWPVIYARRFAPGAAVCGKRQRCPPAPSGPAALRFMEKDGAPGPAPGGQRSAGSAPGGQRSIGEGRLPAPCARRPAFGGVGPRRPAFYRRGTAARAPRPAPGTPLRSRLAPLGEVVGGGLRLGSGRRSVGPPPLFGARARRICGGQRWRRAR